MTPENIADHAGSEIQPPVAGEPSETAASVAPVALEAPSDPPRSAIAEWTITILLLLFLTTTLVQAYVIPTGSMEDTLLIGDHLLVDKLAYAPPGPVSKYLLPYTEVHRGDIIVFRYPVDIRQTFVKRVIGEPGDRLHIVNKQVYRNGSPANEPYKIHKTDYIAPYRDNFPSEPDVMVDRGALDMLQNHVVDGEVVVPPNSYFAMGDNRDNSLDSRYWGFVPRENIIGKPLIIYWSYDAPSSDLQDPSIGVGHILDVAKNFFEQDTLESELYASAPLPRQMSNFQRASRDFVFEWTLNILILLFGTTMLVQAFIVPTASMDTTVMVGDHLLVDKLSYSPPGAIGKYILPFTEPKRGDVIVFRYPMDIKQNYVKRVMGVPGDHIHILNKVVYLNGKPLQEPYAQHIFPNLEPYRDTFPSEPAGPVVDRAVKMLAEHVQNGELVVPEGSYFAMGDNRDNSLDSRYWGFVPRDYIIGKPLFIFWSYDAPTEDWIGGGGGHYVDLLENFFGKTRWNRTLKLVRGIPVGQ